MENKKKLYEALSGEYDMGDFDTFANDVNDAAKRRKLYDAIKDSYDLGDFDSFSNQLLGGTQHPQSTLAELREQSKQSAEQAEKMYNESEVIYNEDKPYRPAFVPQQAPAEGVVQAEANKKVEEMKSAAPDFLQPMYKAVDQAHNARMNIERGMQGLETPTQREYDEKMESINKTVQMGTITPQQADVQRKALEIGQSISSTPTDEMIRRTNARGVAELSKVLDERMGEKEAKAKSQIKSFDDAIGVKSTTQSHIYTPTHLLAGDADYQMMKAAKRSLNDAQAIIDEADHQLNAGNYTDWQQTGAAAVGRGMQNKLFDVRTWDMGMTDVHDALWLREALDKADNGEELTEAEKALLDAKAYEMAVNAYFGSYVGMGYTMGQGAAESIPFMLEFAINPLSAVGKTAQNKLVRYALKKYGKGLFQKKLKYNALKYGTRLVGDLVGGGTGMTLTSSLPRTIADATSRTIGQIKPEFADYTGRAEFSGTEGGVSAGRAAYEAIAAGTFERFSEMMSYYTLPIMKPLTKAAGKVVDKFTPSKVTKVLDDMSHNLTYKQIQDFFKRTQWHGVFGESLEEFGNNLLNAAFVGDMNFGSGENGVFNPELNKEMLFTVALTGGYISTIATAGYGVSKYKAYRGVKRADEKAADYFGEDWATLKPALSTVDNNALNAYEAIEKREDYTDLQKAAAKTYLYATAVAKGATMADLKRKTDAERPAEDVQVELSYDIGRSLRTPEEMNEAKMDLEEAANALRERFLLRKNADVDAFLGDNAIDSIIGSMELGGSVEEAQLKLDYLNKKAIYDGMLDQIRDNVEDEVNESNIIIDSRVNKETGRIQPAKISTGDALRDVYIVGGNVELLDDGEYIDRDRSTKNIVVMDAVTGKLEMTTPDQLREVKHSLDVNEVKTQLASNIKENRVTEESNKIDGILPFTEGDVYTITDKGGDVHQATIMQNNGDGTALVSIDGYEATQMMIADVQAMADAYKITQRAERKAVEEQEVQNTFAEVEQEAQEREAQTQQAAERESTPNTSSIPVDENGNRQYTQVDADTAWNALVEQTDGDIEMAMDVANSMTKKAEKALENVKKKSVAEGNTPEEMIAAKKAHKEKIAQAQAEVYKWKEIASTPQRRAEEAQRVAEQETKAEAMQERIDKANEAISEEQKKAEQRMRMSNARAALQNGGRYQSENAELGAPIDFADFVMRAIATGGVRFIWGNNPRTGTRGLGSHTGFGEQERRKRIGILSNEGMYPEVAAEQLLASYADEIGHDPGIDTSDALSTILDVVMSHTTPKDMMATAQQRHQIMEDKLTQQEADFAKDKFMRDALAYDAMLREDVLPLLDEHYEEFQAIFAEEYLKQEEYDRSRQNQGVQHGVHRKTRNGASSKGGSSVLPEAQPYNEGTVSTSSTQQKRNEGVDEQRNNQVHFGDVSGTETAVVDEAGLEQNNDEQRQADGSRVVESTTKKMGGGIDRGDIRVLEEGLDATYGKYLPDSERTRRDKESERLVAVAKQNGLFIPLEQTKTLGTKYAKRTGESAVYVNEEAGKVFKVKNPYAKSAMKSGVQPEDAIFEHTIHNLLFPETAYTFEGISEDLGDVRFVLSQQLIRTTKQPTQQQIVDALATRGLVAEDKYSFGNDLVSVTDVEGDNVLLGENGELYFIDPIIKFKKPAREIIDALTTQSQPSISQQIEQAEQDTNIEPTKAQKEAGNYRKGHIKIDGFDITIETPKGVERSGVDEQGNKWSVKMNNTYGYIRGIEGVDGDHIDLFISDNIDNWSGSVYVIDQVNPDGSFDEHKVMYGFNSIEEAQQAYLANYSIGWQGLGAITGTTKEEFQKWVASSHRKTKPFAEYKSVKTTEGQSVEQPKYGKYQQFHDEFIEGLNAKKFIPNISQIRTNIRQLKNKIKALESGMAINVSSDEEFAKVQATVDDATDQLNAYNDILDTINKQMKEAERQAAIDGHQTNKTPTLSQESEQVGDRDNAPYTIVPSQYTTKKGKVLDMHLVKFAGTLTKEQQRAAKELAKAEKGWYDREQGGFMMRSEESAKQLADTILNNDDAVSDAQPVSLADTRKIVETEQQVQPTNPSGNRLVTDERYAELRERMRKKLGGQMNIGIDPEILAIGTEMAVYHLEKGARKFTEYAKAMIADLGDAIRPYLKAFYNGARNLPEVESSEIAADMTPYDEVQQFNVATFDKEHSDPFTTAEIVVAEQAHQEEAEQAKQEIINQRNTERRNEDEQTSASTKAIASQAETVADKAESDIETATTEEQLNDVVATIDKQIKEVNKQLALLGYYEADIDDSQFHESYGYMRSAEKKAVKDADTLAKRIVKDLGIDPASIVDKKGKKRKVIAQANIAPAGGDISIRLPLTASRELYIDVLLESDYEGGNRDNLFIDHIYLRIEDPTAGGYKQFVGRNVWVQSDATYTDMLDEIRAEIIQHVPEFDLPTRQSVSETEQKQPKAKKSKKKAVYLQQSGELGLFDSLFDNETNNEDGLQRNDATRSEGVSANGNRHEQGLSRGSETGSESEQQGSRGTDNGRETTGDAVDRTVRPRLSDTVTEPKNTRNNHSERGKDHAPTSVDARIEANIKAIELAKQLLESGEQATEKQMQTLRKFSGWGGLGKAFSEGTYYAPNNIAKRLRELLGEAAYQEAVMSANSAYYTPAYVVDTLWDIAEQMGFKGGNILEGSAGIGNILGQMPTHISERSDIHAIEIDGTSGGILSLLYPDAKVEIQGFEETRIANGSVDLAITNVPFVTGLRVNDTTGDKDLSKKFHNIHDFCIAKNVRKLREGGLGIFITSNGTLDNSKKLRDWIVNEGGADFVGAFRMHNKTFGGTGVTSDIIVIRKRVNGKKSANAIDVSTVTGERMAEYDTGETRKVKGQIVPVVKQLSMDYNQYFVEHPENMAGEMHFAFEKGDTFRPTSKGLYPKQDKKQEQMLAEFVQSFTAEEFGEKATDEIEVIDAMPGKKIGEVFVSDGKLYINAIGAAQPLEVNANKVKGHTKVECFEAYSAIKEALAAVLEYQITHEDDKGLKPLLAKLNKAYDDFVATYGHFNKNTAIAFLRNDVDYVNVFALEKFEESADAKGNKVHKFGKTDVFSKRVIEKEAEPMPTNVKDGIVASIFKFGRVDIPYIAEQLGKSEAEVKAEIIESGYGFENPATRQVEVSYQYLSGNVREKLRQAQENNENGVYDRNIKALQEVMPMDIPAHLIDFTLGSSWIEPKLYEEYVKERTEVGVQFTAVGGTWFMNEPYFTNYEKNRAMGVTSEMLGRTKMGHTLIEAAIQNRSITVSTTKKNWDGSTETITDKEATQACAAKIDEIRQDFKEWARQKMQSDAEMSERMERIYNDTFNNYVPMSIPDDFVPEYFGGASHKFKMRPHQGRAIVRGTMQPLLLAHEVGTGKTFTLISTAMEMRRLGTARKPMIVVQNTTVGQFVASAKELYPNAKILTLEEADRSAEGRKNFYAKIRYNDWDMIVVPQSTFEFIPDSEERQMTFVQEKIEEKMLVLEKMKEADPDGKSMITRQAEREIAALEEQLAGLSGETGKKRTANDEKKRAVALQNAEVKALEMLDRRTDDVENFDDMGIDALLIDEAHEYKHLGFATAMQRGVKGVDPSYSKKSQGVFLKTRAVLEKNNGRNVIFATGTPISNTAAEIWTFMRYLMPADTMEEYGIYYFDDFVRNFGNIQQMLEFTTSGKFKENNRFAGYVNLPELERIWSGVSDTVLTKEAGGVSDKIPEMESGKAQDLYLPQTRALRSIMKFVKAQLEEYDKMSGKEKKENSHIPLTMYNIAKAAAVDARLVQSDAEDDTNSKTNEAVRQTLRSLQETAEYKGTVAIFADNYQNKESGFNLYEDIRAKLIAEGVPANEIVVMKSGMTVKKKLEIFEKVNRGEVRVILGSTFTLGTGVNIQERLHTLIHLDAPNRPMDYTQRNGRILRQGNLHKAMGKPVRILRFGVEDSLDVTAYQRLKTKGAIADSIMNGKQMMANSMTNRVLEEEEDVFGDTVAQLSGSEYAMLKNNAEKNVRKYASRKKQWEADQTYIHNAKPRVKAFIKDAEKRIEDNSRYLEAVRSSFPDGKFKEIVIGKHRFTTIDAMEDFFKEHNKSLLAEMKQMKDREIAGEQKRQLTIQIGDFSFVVTTKLTQQTVRDGATLFNDVERKMTYSCAELGIEDIPVRQNLLRNAIEDITHNVITGRDFSERLEAAERSKKHNEAELEQLLSREGKPFEYEAELEQAKAQYEEYAELMKKELEQKEAKYAEMDATVEAANDLATAEEADELEREGVGSYTYDELALESDPVSKALGKPRGTRKQRREFAQRERQRMVERVEKLAKKLHLDNVEVVTDASTLEGKKQRAKGFYTKSTGKITIVIPNHSSAFDVEQTLLHEAVAHYGLRQLFGEHFETFLDNVFNNADVAIRQRIVALAAKNGWDFHKATEEYLAMLAENTEFENTNANWWRQIKDFFLNMLHKIGFEDFRGVTLTDNELRYILWRSYQMQKNKGAMAVAEDVDMQRRLGVGNFHARQVSEEEQIVALAKKNGSYLKAPNGKPTNLSTKQWAQVRTKAFKEWFGDWENDPKNASKVVDENGEPKVVYNGSKVQHYQYDGRLRTKGQSATNSKVSFFTDSKAVAERYGKFVNEVFLNIRNPYEVDYKGAGWQGWSGADDGKQRMSTDSYADLLANGSVDSTLERIIENYGRAEADHLASGSVRNDNIAPDGVIAYEVADPMRSTLYIVRNAEAKDISRNSVTPKGVETFTKLGKASLLFDSQIKSATDNVGSFSKDNDDIRYRQGSVAPPSTGEAKDYYNKAVRTPNKSGSVKKSDNLAHRLQEAYQDSMLSVRELMEGIRRETGAPYIKDMADVYTAENRLSSANKAQIDAWERDFFAPLMEEVIALTNKGAAYEDILEYIVAKHGLERNLVFSQRDAEKDGGVWDGFVKKDYSGLIELTGEANLFTEAAQQIVDEFEQKFNTQNFWDAINNATKATLKKSFDSGMMSKETYDNLTTMFKHYVPLRGWANNVAADEYEYMGSSNMKILPTLKTAKGRTSLAEDPLATIGTMGESAIIQGNKNLMKQKLLNLASQYPTSLLTVSEQWYVKQPNGKWIVDSPYIPGDATGDEVAQILADHKKEMEALGSNATKQREGLDLDLHLTRAEGQEHAVRVKRNGKEYVVYVNGNPIAAQAINGFTNPNAATPEDWMKTLKERTETIKNYMARAFTSANPAFVISNLSRDVIWAGTAVAIKENAAYTAQYTKNITREFLKAELPRLVYKWQNGTLDKNVPIERFFKEFLLNGGETGFTQLNTVDDYKKNMRRMLKEAQKGSPTKVMKAVSGVVNGIEFLNRSAEDTTRFAVYLTSRQMGRSVARSIDDAKNITVNFNKKGRGNMGAAALGYMYIFFNASIQSIANFGKLVKEHPIKTATWLSAYGSAGFLTPIITMAIQSLIGDDNDDNSYWNLPEWVRRNNLILPLGANGYVTVPLPHELRPFYALGEIALSVLAGKEDVEDGLRKAVAGFAGILPVDPTGNAGDIIINFTPTFAQPIMQIARNTDYFGVPIYKDSPFNRNAPEWTKAYKGTSPLLVNGTRVWNEIWGGDAVKSSAIDEKGKKKALGFLTDVNPAIIEHLFESYLGGMGKTYNKLAKTIGMIWNEDLRTMRNTPILSSFVYFPDERNGVGGEVNTLYYDATDEARETERIVSGYKKQVKMGAEEYAEKLDELLKSPLYQRYKVIRPRRNEVNKLRTQLEDRDITNPDSVEQAIYEVKEMMIKELEELESRGYEEQPDERK